MKLSEIRMSSKIKRSVSSLLSLQRYVLLHLPFSIPEMINTSAESKVLHWIILYTQLVILSTIP